MVVVLSNMSDVFMHLYSRYKKLEPIREKPNYVNPNYYPPVILNKKNIYIKNRPLKFQKDETNVKPIPLSPDFTISEMTSSLLISPQEIAPRISSVTRNYDLISMKRNSLNVIPQQKMQNVADFPTNENIEIQSKDRGSKISSQFLSSNKNIDENKSPVTVLYPHDILDSTRHLHSTSLISLYPSISTISSQSTTSSNNHIATMLLNPMLPDHSRSYQQLATRKDSPIKCLYDGKNLKNEKSNNFLINSYLNHMF